VNQKIAVAPCFPTTWLLQKPADAQLPGDAEDDADPPERMQRRITELVRLEGIRSLCKYVASDVGDESTCYRAAILHY
jgi:hypothetical protein